MELREPIDYINQKLIDEYGYELNAGGQPKFRVVFSEDQYEHRLTNFTDEGFELLQPEVRLLPKYKQYIQQKYILERLVPVDPNNTDLTVKVSYEPAWVFQDKNQNYLPPFFEGCKHVIESMFYAIGQANTFTKYKDNTTDPEIRAAELQKMQDELFGNDTDLTDNLHYGSGIVVPDMKTVH